MAKYLQVLFITNIYKQISLTDNEYWDNDITGVRIMAVVADGKRSSNDLRQQRETNFEGPYGKQVIPVKTLELLMFGRKTYVYTSLKTESPKLILYRYKEWNMVYV